jgi:hypothetical protein
MLARSQGRGGELTAKQPAAHQGPVEGDQVRDGHVGTTVRSSDGRVGIDVASPTHDPPLGVANRFDPLGHLGLDHVRLGVEVVDGEGDGRLEAVTLRHRAGDELERLPTSALFAHIGAQPRTEWLEGLGRTGSVRPCPDRRRPASRRRPAERLAARASTAPVRNQLPGVFAAGDVRHGSIKRVASAVGEGAVAVQLVHQYLAEQQGAIAPALAERTR